MSTEQTGKVKQESARLPLLSMDPCQIRHRLVPRSCLIIKKVPVVQYHTCVQQGPPTSLGEALCVFCVRFGEPVPG